MSDENFITQGNIREHMKQQRLRQEEERLALQGALHQALTKGQRSFKFRGQLFNVPDSDVAKFKAKLKKRAKRRAETKARKRNRSN